MNSLKSSQLQSCIKSVLCALFPCPVTYLADLFSSTWTLSTNFLQVPPQTGSRCINFPTIWLLTSFILVLFGISYPRCLNSSSLFFMSGNRFPPPLFPGVLPNFNFHGNSRPGVYMIFVPYGFRPLNTEGFLLVLGLLCFVIISATSLGSIDS